MPEADFSRQRGRTDVTLDQRRVLLQLCVVHGLDLDRLELALEALLVDLPVTRHADRERLATAVRVLEHDQHVLERVAGRPGPVVTGERHVQVVDQGLDGRGVGGVLGVRGGDVVVRRGGGRPDGDRLDVGGVVAAGAADVGVLAHVGLGQELLRLRPSHRATGRLDDGVVEAEPVEGLDVGLAVGGVRPVETLVGGVEGVGVLHDELATTEHARAWPRLVAVLRLDLVEPDRQVLVGGVHVLHREGEQLLVRGTEQVVAALAVLEPEDAVAVGRPPVAGLVGLAREQRREGELLGPHRVHLLADDLLDLAQHPQAERQPGVDARGVASDVAGSDEQPVARHLGVRGVVAKRAHEQAGHPQDHDAQATCRAAVPANQFTRRRP